MPERTDEQLIQLVQEKLPEELTPDEIAALRERLQSSPELQRTLIEQMHLEGYLAAALGEFSVSFDDIVRRAKANPQKSRTPLIMLGISSAVLLLAIGLSLGLRKKPQDEVAGPDPAHAVAKANHDGVPGTPTESAETPDAANPNGAPETKAEPREPFSLVVEAEKFDRSNLLIDSTNYGDGIGVIHSGEQITGFAEYDVDVPAAGLFQIELRYASDEPRPVKLIVNGTPVRPDAARHDTGDWWPEGQRAFVEARVELPAGKTMISLQTDGLFPHVDKIGIVELEAKPNTVPVAKATEGLPVMALRTLPPAAVAEGTPGAVKAPWEAAFDPSKPLVPFAKSAFAGFPVFDPQYNVRASELKEWFDPIGKAYLHIADIPVGNRPFPLFDGLARLKAPWPRDAVLRFGMFDMDRLRFHFWNGDEGVSLQWFPKQEMWAAFHVKRKPGEPTPFERSLVTTDDGRHARTELGVFELRHQSGTLVMTRGDMRLLTVPMPRPPKEVVYEGKLRVSGFAMFRGEAAPDEPANPRRILVDTREPADLKWVSQLSSPADMEMAPDGSMALRSSALGKGKMPELIRCATPLEKAGLYEVIVRVTGASPGTGVFLGDAQGNPIHHVGFFQEERSKRTTFGFGWSTYGYEKPAEFRAKSNHDPDAEPVPWASSDQWLRIVLGSGGLKIWTSGDGIHWGRAMREPIRGARGIFSSVGLYAVTAEQPRQIKLQKLEVREFSGLTALADAAVRARMPRINALETMDYAAWIDAMLRTRPRDVALPEWRRAFAVGSLLQNPRSELAATIQKALLTDMIAPPSGTTPFAKPQGVPPRAGAPAKEASKKDGAAPKAAPPVDPRFLALDDVTLVGDLWPGVYALSFTDLYTRLAEQMAKEGAVDPFNRASFALATSPLQTEMKFNPLPPALVRLGTIWSVNAQRWEEARALSTRVRQWLRSGYPENRIHATEMPKQWLAEWSDAVAAHWQTGKVIGPPPALQADWRHPLVTQLSREGFNVLSELESALEGKAYEDASQLITATATSGVLGLLPDARDPLLQVSMPRAIVLAMRDHPDLQATMRDRYGKLGLLRVRQAVQDGQLEVVQAAAMQYYGTEAASEANRWLGDRAVASGRFARGIDHYREALPMASAAVTVELGSRIRLASALLGQSTGDPATSSIELGSTTLSPDSFEALVGELQKSRAAGSGASSGVPGQVAAADLDKPLPLGQVEIKSHGRMSGDLGQSPGAGAPADVDWGGRQLAISEDGPVMYVSNRFSVGAWDANERKWLWTVGLGGEQGNTNAWSLQPMRPAVAGDRIFVRRLTKNGPELACLEKKTGKVQWNRRPERHVVSDPVWTREKLLAVIATRPEGNIIQFEMAAFHPDTGEVLSQEPLFRARDIWGGTPPCSIVAVTGRLICCAGGSLVACDLRGHAEWLRQPLWLPPALDPTSHQVALVPPVVSGDVIYHIQPGAHEVACIDTATGRRRWSRPVTEPRRVLGVTDKTLIVQNAAGLVAFAADGTPRWEWPCDSLLEASLCGSTGPIVVSRRVDWNADQRAPSLVWIDPADGREVGSTTLRGYTDPQPRFGPMLYAAGRWWAFFGKSADAGRELLELTPGPGPRPVALADAEWANWLPNLLPRHVTESAVALPGWTPTLLTPANPNWLAEFRGEKDALLTRSDPGRPVSWVRRIDAAKGQPAKLSLRVAHQSGQAWTLLVSTGAEEIERIAVDDKSAPSGWLDATVDLSAVAGKPEWLVVQAIPKESGKAIEAAWRKLELVP